MFSGIIQHIGTVELVENGRLVVSCASVMDEFIIGESIAVNGVCLTLESATREELSRMFFSVGPETQKVTTLGILAEGSLVHLERALSLNGLVGGHLVQGHVDGIGIVLGREIEGECLQLRIGCPAEISQYCVEKGSIAVDGVSLTLNAVANNFIEVCLIPHTLASTFLGELAVGEALNLECDLIGKYVRTFMQKSEQRIQL